jgi:hypothetical protein
MPLIIPPPLLRNSGVGYIFYSSGAQKDPNAEYVCADHYGRVTGDEVQNFIRQTMEVARQERTFLEVAFQRAGAIDNGAKELTADFYLSEQS